MMPVLIIIVLAAMLLLLIRRGLLKPRVDGADVKVTRADIGQAVEVLVESLSR